MVEENKRNECKVRRRKPVINKKKIYKEYKRNKNLGLKLCFALVLAIYTFFFLSPYIFHQSSKVDYTPYNEDYTIEKTSVSVESWKYSKKQNKMEIILNINNFSSTVINYNYYAFCNYDESSRGKTQLKIKEKLKEINYAVLWIYNIPKDFNGCAVLITENHDIDKGLTIQTNKSKVEQTDNISLKSIEDYHITKYKKIINELNKSIEKENKSIAKCKKSIEQYKKMIIDTQKTEIYQSEKEVAQTEKTIDSYRSKISVLNSNIEESNNNITDLKNQIAKYDNLINRIKKEEK